MRSILKSLAFGGTVALVGVVAPVFAQSGERDYLVHVGKRPVWASELKRQATRPTPTVDIRSNGSYQLVGKAIVWVPDGQQPPFVGTQRVNIARQTPTESRGRFVQRGKATVWQPDTGSDSQIAEKPNN